MEIAMKSLTKLFFTLLIGTITLPAGASPAARADTRVVTTLTDLADFVKEVGGKYVDVKSLATGVEDTHGVPMKPSFVPMMNRADMIVLVGFDCEHSFLPALLEASKNPQIQYGKPGYIDCAKGIVPAEIPKSTDHSEGDVHPYGNPHYMLDPERAKQALQTIASALIAKDPTHEEEFKKNRDAYVAKLDAKISEWKEKLKPLKGLKFVSYHGHWFYFAERFGLVYFGTIELKPGIDPTARHIENLVSAMKAEHVPVVVREPQFPEKVPALIAEQAGAKLVKLPIMPNGVPKTGTYIEMMDYIVQSFVDAAPKK
jgi:zinc/manganese transport system substrate-binding protein